MLELLSTIPLSVFMEMLYMSLASASIILIPVMALIIFIGLYLEGLYDRRSGKSWMLVTITLLALSLLQLSLWV